MLSISIRLDLRDGGNAVFKDSHLLFNYFSQLTGILIGAAVALALIGIVICLVYRKVKQSSKCVPRA